MSGCDRPCSPSACHLSISVGRCGPVTWRLSVVIISLCFACARGPDSIAPRNSSGTRSRGSLKLARAARAGHYNHISAFERFNSRNNVSNIIINTRRVLEPWSELDIEWGCMTCDVSSVWGYGLISLERGHRREGKKLSRKDHREATFIQRWCMWLMAYTEIKNDILLSAEWTFSVPQS